MDVVAWKAFLRQWSVELLASTAAPEDLPQDVIESGWLGYPGAAEAQIMQAEVRLGATLPPSYRTFLTVTNGWRELDYVIDELWSTEGVEWFSVRHQPWIDLYVTNSGVYPDPPSMSDSEYLVYGHKQDSARFRREYLQTVLEISPASDSAILLLNPNVLTSEGEWEAWYFAGHLPGARRYRSFEEMMKETYKSFLRLKDI